MIMTLLLKSTMFKQCFGGEYDFDVTSKTTKFVIFQQFVVLNIYCVNIIK